VALDAEGGGDIVAGDAWGSASAGGVIIRGLTDRPLLAIDDERLYWAVGGSVYGCLKSNCKSSFLTYFRTQPGWLASQGDELLWATQDAVMSCPRAGCSGAPRELGIGLHASRYAVDDTFIAALGTDAIQIMPRTGGAWSPLLPLSGRQLAPVALHADYVYWLEQSEDSVETLVFRAPTLGDGPVETVAHFPASSEGADLDFGSASVYFTDSRQGGAVLRCPLAGCVGAPEDVLGPIRAPSQLAVDDRGVCALYDLTLFDQAVGCAAGFEPPLSQRFAHATQVVMDADYVYAAHSRVQAGTPDVPLLIDISRWAR
jgi:hypothetical protein